MDWYRKTSWNENDEKDFFEKLKRARNYSRPQYLRIQAITLISTENQNLLKVAENLLVKILEDYPEEKFEKSLTFNSLGNIYKQRNELEKAREFYRKSLNFEKEYPNVKTDSYLQFAELTIKLQKLSEYDYVRSLLEPEISESLFPIEKYKGFTILSIINSQNGNLEKAKKYENLANENANAKTTNLRYHKYLGIVKERDSWLEKLINKK